MPTQKELAKLRADYLLKRENILKGRVNSLQATLFEKVYNEYLDALQTDASGKLVNSIENRNIVAGLDKIYAQFQLRFNTPTVNSFVSDLGVINDLNYSYFKHLDKEGTRANAPQVKKAVDSQLGLKPDGSIKKGGFTDKFLRDETVLKNIKKITNQAISKEKGFQDFRKDLKEYVTGNPKIKESGGLQQYYRNYAYDTFQKVDRLNQQEFAQKLGLKWGLYSGGLIKTSRNFCIHYNGRIINLEEFGSLTISDIPENQRAGLPAKGWKPLDDCGGFGCRHSIDVLPASFAQENKSEYNKAAAEKAKAFKEKNRN